MPDGQCETSSRSSASSSVSLILVSSAIEVRAICRSSRRWRRRAPKLSGMGIPYCVKSQAPTTKLQPLPNPNLQVGIAKYQLPNPRPPAPFWDLGVGLGIWELGVVGAWDLELGI